MKLLKYLKEELKNYEECKPIKELIKIKFIYLNKNEDEPIEICFVLKYF